MLERMSASSIVMVLVLSILGSPAAADSRKTAVLKQKMIAISALRVKIIDKIDQGIEMRSLLEERLKELRDEIEIEQNRSGINEYELQTPLENWRIIYNLNLIQHLRAYIDRLDERIDYFQTGNERLKYYLHQIEDDIAIINTLQDMEVENLISRIDTVLDEFIPETGKKIFDAFEIRLMPAEQIWKEMTAKPS